MAVCTFTERFIGLEERS